MPAIEFACKITTSPWGQISQSEQLKISVSDSCSCVCELHLQNTCAMTRVSKKTNTHQMQRIFQRHLQARLPGFFFFSAPPPPHNTSIPSCVSPPSVQLNVMLFDPRHWYFTYWEWLGVESCERRWKRAVTLKCMLKAKPRLISWQVWQTPFNLNHCRGVLPSTWREKGGRKKRLRAGTSSSFIKRSRQEERMCGFFFLLHVCLLHLLSRMIKKRKGKKNPDVFSELPNWMFSTHCVEEGVVLLRYGCRRWCGMENKQTNTSMQ